MVLSSFMVEFERRQSGLILPLNADFSDTSPETHSIPNPPIFFTENWDELIRISNQGGLKWFYEKEFGLYVVCPEKYKVERYPKQHRDEHGNVISDAFYYIDEYFTDEGYAIYLSYLPPGKMTSTAHRHSKDMIEHYKLIRGSAEMTLGYDMARTIPFTDYIRVPFGMGHRMRANFPDGALTLITTENPHNLPAGTLHLRDEVPSRV